MINAPKFAVKFTLSKSPAPGGVSLPHLYIKYIRSSHYVSQKVQEANDAREVRGGQRELAPIRVGEHERQRHLIRDILKAPDAQRRFLTSSLKSTSTVLPFTPRP